jgi:hypothetical protein
MRVSTGMGGSRNSRVTLQIDDDKGVGININMLNNNKDLQTNLHNSSAVSQGKFYELRLNSKANSSAYN